MAHQPQQTALEAFAHDLDDADAAVTAAQSRQVTARNAYNDRREAAGLEPIRNWSKRDKVEAGDQPGSADPEPEEARGFGVGRSDKETK
jgi:hypothetical protein